MVIKEKVFSLHTPPSPMAVGAYNKIKALLKSHFSYRHFHVHLDFLDWNFLGAGGKIVVRTINLVVGREASRNIFEKPLKTQAV